MNYGTVMLVMDLCGALRITVLSPDKQSTPALPLEQPGPAHYLLARRHPARRLLALHVLLAHQAGSLALTATGSGVKHCPAVASEDLRR